MEYVSLFFFLMLFCSIVSAGLAYDKGRNPIGWFCVGILGNVFAILAVLIAPENTSTLDERGIKRGTHKTCGFCDEVVKRNAVKCRYCHSPLDVSFEKLPKADGF